MSVLTDIKNTVSQNLSASSWLNQSSLGFLVKPYSTKGISGFVFSIKDEEQIELRADVTDYVMEDATVKQDHIVIKPKVITLRGFIGELVNDVQPALVGVFGKVQEKLTALEQYYPLWTQDAIQARNIAIATSQADQIKTIDDIALKTENLVTSLGFTLPGQTKQEQAFNSLSAMWASRQIVTVETPWGYFDKMAIMSVVFAQDAKTQLMTDITIQLKEIKLANVESISLFDVSPITGSSLARTLNKGKFKGVQIGAFEFSLKSSNQKLAWQATGGF